jgi:tetratricopeptide (TPR) repeat protein
VTGNRRRTTALFYLLLAAGLAALTAYAAVALRIHHARAAPERLDEGYLGRITGPPGSVLAKAAQRHLESGLASLNDTSSPPRERIAGYRAELHEAEALLVRSLSVDPVQPRAIAQLAAVHWELGPQEDDAARSMRLVETAARLAPGNPLVQKDLGELLLKMNRVPEALRYFHRSLVLQPELADEVVAYLQEQLLTAEELIGALPVHDKTLVALQHVFFAEGKERPFIELVQSHLAQPTPALIGAYANAHHRVRDWQRLSGALERLGPYPDPRLEAERLLQQSKAALQLGQMDVALAHAASARQLAPASVTHVEHWAQVALRAGRAEEAIGGFNDALGILARTSPQPAWRARLYRQIGQAEESRRRPDRAYDSYRMALTLDPEEEHARLRMHEMKRASGFKALY